MKFPWATDEDIDRVVREQPTETYRKERQPRACTECGRIRTVKVTWWRDWKTKAWGPPNYAKRCKGCEHLASAKHYERIAAQNRQQASEYFANYGKRLQPKVPKKKP